MSPLSARVTPRWRITDYAGTTLQDSPVEFSTVAAAAGRSACSRWT